MQPRKITSYSGSTRFLISRAWFYKTLQKKKRKKDHTQMALALPSGGQAWKPRVTRHNSRVSPRRLRAAPTTTGVLRRSGLPLSTGGQNTLSPWPYCHSRETRALPGRVCTPSILPRGANPDAADGEGKPPAIHSRMLLRAAEGKTDRQNPRYEANF